MTAPSKHQYHPGQRVLVEGVVVDWQWGQPYGSVRVSFPSATDPNFLLDGLDGWHPQALVFAEGEDVFDLNYFTAQEGLYEDDEENA